MAEKADSTSTQSFEKDDIGFAITNWHEHSDMEKARLFRYQNTGVRKNNFFQIAPENARFRFEASDMLVYFRLAVNFAT